MIRRLTVSLVFALGLVACSSSSPTLDGDAALGVDTGVSLDSGHADTGVDSGALDAGVDAATADAGYDAGTDAAPRFVVANGTVTDTSTGLIWQAMDWGSDHTQAQAVSYCNGLMLDGSSSWRLPSKDEILAVAGAFPIASANTFWTSTTGANPGTYWYANFMTGAASASGGGNLFHARCVR
jgi:hypothetical protein